MGVAVAGGVSRAVEAGFLTTVAIREAYRLSKRERRELSLDDDR